MRLCHVMGSVSGGKATEKVPALTEPADAFKVLAVRCYLASHSITLWLIDSSIY